jgi:exodeoxyribonuclease V alpha subunit
MAQNVSPRGHRSIGECGDLLVVDETSMVGVMLMNHLLGALPRSASPLLVGNVDQSPLVGPGMVLGSPIDSGVVLACAS